MKIILQASTLVLALGLGSGAATAQPTPATEPNLSAPVPEPSPAAPAPKAAPAAPAPKAAVAQPAPKAGFGPAEPGDVRPPQRPSRLSGTGTDRVGEHEHAAHVRRSVQHRSLRYATRWHRDVAVSAPSYEIAAEKRRLAYRAGYRRGLHAAAVYAYPRRVYRTRHVTYVTRVTHAYAETPFAYDLPRETYATGIFPTTSAIGLHSYDYAYTTRIRPIATYAGATGSYAGGYPIYNRPLAPAYPTCPCY